MLYEEKIEITDGLPLLFSAKYFIYSGIQPDTHKRILIHICVHLFVFILEMETTKVDFFGALNKDSSIFIEKT